MKSWRDWPIKKVNEIPESLKSINNPPQQLYYRGNWNKEIFQNCLAVVGSRRMTSYGERVMERILPDIVSSGITIISGFMYGVDTLAHKLTLQFKGKTIAIFACGLDEVIPPENDQLYSEILASGGLALSEYDKNIKARLWTFPLRNRLVAGLSQGVLVIEGGEKSGSLVTAKLAKEQGKIVMAVPGPVTGAQSFGTNWLIKNGAAMIVEAGDVLKFFKLFTPEVKVSHTSGVNVIEHQILQVLADEPMSADDLCRSLTIDIVKLEEILSLMMLKGLLIEKSGKYNQVC